jgi:hypothetical protein
MSICSASALLVPGWGLPKESLDEVIMFEKLKDLTMNFLGQTLPIIKRFDFDASIRVLAFNEGSGGNNVSKSLFRAMVSCDRTVIYYPILSNNGCCVVLASDPKGVQELKTKEHILAHEYAHHIHAAHTDFPYYFCKGPNGGWVPPFSRGCEIGPTTGMALVDSLALPDMKGVIKDCAERIHDIICEGLLTEKSITEGYLEWFEDEIRQRIDPAVALPSFLRTPSMKRYVRRLVIRDYAEWGAKVQLANPKLNLTQTLSKAKKHAIKLNKKHINADHAYNEIFKLCATTNFHAFKSLQNTLNYTKKILNLLNIKINTKEKW